jgi:hypothetical protein
MEHFVPFELSEDLRRCLEELTEGELRELLLAARDMKDSDSDDAR